MDPEGKHNHKDFLASNKPLSSFNRRTWYINIAYLLKNGKREKLGAKIKMKSYIARQIIWRTIVWIQIPIGSQNTNRNVKLELKQSTVNCHGN